MLEEFVFLADVGGKGSQENKILQIPSDFSGSTEER
jgi:hypothetical protein